jgi:hypothetical protein
MQKMKPLTARAECTVFAVCLLGANLSLATSVGVTNAPAQTPPQGKDPPGNDNDPQATPSPSVGEGVIRPPETSDNDIETTVPNPHAGPDEEVIHPPGGLGED